MMSGIASAVGMGGSTPEGLCKNGHPMEEQDVEAGWSSYGCDYWSSHGVQYREQASQSPSSTYLHAIHRQTDWEGLEWLVR